MNDYNFKPFDKVLVRDNDDKKWMLNMFSHYDETAIKFHFVCLVSCFKNCIPYEGNEHLLGTTDSPKPKRWRAKKNCEYYYINSRVEVVVYLEGCTVVDDEHFNIGNYFRTREEAEEMADKFKAMLKGE